MAAGVAWILTAAVTAYLALLQWSYVGTMFDDGTYQLNALWNGIAAVLTAYFGARCLMNPPRGLLGTSTAWGVLSVAWGAYQIANGATHELFLLSVLGAGVAGILSLAARSAVPSPTVVGPTCVNCGKTVNPDRKELCNHCGLPIAGGPESG